MTRDEQIAQLKPGDELRLVYSGQTYTLIARVGGHPLICGHTNGARPFLEDWCEVVFPEPPPQPKAKPGVRYRSVDSLGFVTRGIGLVDGRVYLTAYEQMVDFDPAVWTPLDGEEP